MDASMNFQADGGNKVVLPGTRGSISDDITLESCNGNVIVGDIKNNSPVVKDLGLSKGDELLGATIYFDNLKKNEVMDILKAAEPFKTGLQLHVKNESKSPDMVFTAPSFNTKSEARSPDNVFTEPSFNLRSNDLDFRDSAYENLYNNKIKKYLKGAKSMENLFEPSSKHANTKSAAGRLAERQSVDLESSGFEMPGGDLKTLNTGVSVPGKQLEYKNPSLSMDLDANTGMRTKTDAYGKIKTPEIDVSVPKIKGTFKGPEVNMDPAFTAPGLKMPEVHISEGKFSAHDNDLHLSAAEVNGNIHIKDPKLNGDIYAASLDTEGPHVNLESSNTKLSSPHFKLPSFGLSGPSVKAPEMDGSVDTPPLNVSLPHVKGNFKGPTVNLPHVDVKGPTFKMPSLGIGTANAGIPDAGLNVHSSNMKGDFDISLPELQTDSDEASIEVNAPDISLQGPEKKVNGPHFKMPSFGLSSPTVKSPELNSDIKAPSLDVTLPKLDGDFKAPDAKVDLPSVDAKAPKFKMPSFGMLNANAAGPDVDLNLKHPELKGDINIPSSKLKGNIEVPDLDINAPNINLKGFEKKMKGPKFEMPSLEMSGPNVKTPDFNVEGNFNGPEVDVSVPKVKGNFKGPEFGVDLPDANISAPKVKMPSIEMPSIQMPSVDLSLPDIKTPNIKSDINMKTPKLKGDIKVPNLDVTAPDINMKGSGKKGFSPHFKMPSFGISGPSVKTPNLDGNLEMPSLDVSLPKVEGELKAPTAKVDIPNIKGKSPTFKISTSDVDLNVKSPEIKGDVDLSSPKLKANIEGPDVDINAPNVSLKTPEKKIKGPQFKMPSFGITGPSLKTPDLDVDGNIKGPDVDVTAPKVKGKFKAPELDVDLPDIEVKTPDIKMPSVDIPSVELSLPEAGLNAKAPELKADIKAPKIDVEAPNVNLKKPHFKMPSFKNFGASMKAPQLDASMQRPEGDAPNVEVKGPRFKMPTLKMFHAKTGIPDADLSLKAPSLKGDIDIPTPRLEGDIRSATLDSKTPDLSINMPEKSMTMPAKIKGPDINLDVPTADVKGPKFKMPSFGLSGTNVKAPKVDGKIKAPSVDVSLPKIDANLKSPSVNVDGPTVEAKSPKFKMPSMGIFNAKGDIPEADLNVKSPNISADINIPSPKLKTSFEGPDVDINAPNINLKGPQKMKGPQFKMPSFGMSGPSLKTPDIDIDTNIRGPKVSAPKVKGNFKVPELDVDLPNVDITAPNIKMPSIDIPSVDVSLPAGGLNMKAPELKGDINIKDPKLKGGINMPNLDVEVPDVNVKGAVNKGFSPHFKMPSLGISGPSVETPRLDGSIETPSLDISLPKIEGDLKAPSTKVDLPSVDLKGPAFKMPSLGIFNSKGSVPDVDLKVKSPDLKGEYDVPSPKLKTGFEGAGIDINAPKINMPDIDIDAPNIHLQGPEKKIKGPQFKMPSFKTPDINVDGNMKVPEIDVSLPKVKGNVKAPVVGMDLPKAEIKAPKITMPSIDIPSVDLSLPDVGLDVKAPELKGDININPKVKGNVKGPNLDVKAPDINVKGSEKKGFSPHFKMPSFGISRPSVKTPKVDGNLEAPSLNASLPKFEGDLEGPSAKVDLPSVNAKGPAFKMPSLEILNTKASVPDVDLNLTSPELKGDFDIPSPKLKANVEAPDLDINMPNINLKGLEKKIKGPKFHMPSFGISEPNLKTPDIDVDGNFKGPDIDVSVPKLKGKAPEIGLDLPDAKIKAPKITMPSIDIPTVDVSIPEGQLNVKSPELKGDVNINKPKLKVDSKIPNLDINAPDIKVKSPQFKMPSLELIGPNVKSPKLDANMTSPSLDVLLPNVKGDFSSPNLDSSAAQIKGPSVKLSGPKVDSPDLQMDSKMKGPSIDLPTPKLKGPEINMDVPKSEAKSSKFKFPSFKFFPKKGSHDIDMNVKSPELSSDASVPKLQSKINTPDVDANVPNINLKKSEKKINVPQFKMHSFGISGSNINAPNLETDDKVNERAIDVSMPETKGTFKVPDVNVAMPSAHVTDSKMKLPSLNISKNTPEANLSVKSPQLRSDACIEVPGMEGNVEGPQLDINVPNINVKKPEAKINAPKFRVPSFGNLASSKQASEFDVTIPSVEGKMESPAVNIDLPNVNVKKPNIHMNLPEITSGKVDQEIHFNANAPDIKGHSEIESPKLKANIESPNIDIDAPSGSLKRSQKNMNLPQFNSPSVQMSGPTIEMPKINTGGNIEVPGVDITLPSVKNTFRGPDMNVHPGDVDISLPKYKLPSASMSPEKSPNPDVSISSDMISSKKKILVPDIDINLESPVDLSAPELKGQAKSPHLEFNSKKENLKSADIKGSGPQYKFPLYGFTGPNVEAPEVNLDSKSDIEAKMPKVKSKSPSVNTDLPNIGVHDKTMKAPSIPGVQIKSNLPDAQLNVDSARLECDIDANGDGLKAKGKDSEKKDSLSWFKKPLFGKSKATVETPEVDISSNMSAAKVQRAGPKLSSNEHQGLSLEKNINITDGNLNTQLRTPQIGISVTGDNKSPHTAAADLDSSKESRHQNSPDKKGKGSSLKFPIDFSGIPDIDFAFTPPK